MIVQTKTTCPRWYDLTTDPCIKHLLHLRKEGDKHFMQGKEESP